MESIKINIAGAPISWGVCEVPNWGHQMDPSRVLKEMSELGLKKEQVPNGLFYKGSGCVHCSGTGYKGRCGIYELMPMTSRIKAQVLKSQDAEELRKVALTQEMVSLFQQGVALVCAGVTTSSEVLRVTRMVEEVN